MPKTLLLAIASFFSLTTFVGPASAASFDSKWKATFGGKDNNGYNSSSKIVEFKTDLQANYALSDQLSLFIFPSLRLQSGVVQTVDKDVRAENKIVLREASATYDSASYFEVTTGALDQSVRHATQFMGERAFPGIRASLNFINNDSIKFQSSFEYSIPTSTSLSTNTTEVESTPTFTNVQLFLKQKNVAESKFYIGYYAYQNLPSSVAADSALIGNSTFTASQTDYRFQYLFGGYEAGAVSEIDVSKILTLTYAAHAGVNSNAPEGENKFYYLNGGVLYHMSKRIDLKPYGGLFRTEPDAVVAAFVGNQFQGSNRAGRFFGFDLKFNKEKFLIKTEYTESDVIFISPTQDRERSLLIRLETDYAHI